MFKFFTKNKSPEKCSAEEAFLRAEAQLTSDSKIVTVNDNLEVTYNLDTEIIEKRFELLNDSYNQLLRVEKTKRAKEDLTNKVVARKKYVDKIPRRKKYTISKVKLIPELNVEFSIDNLDEYFAEAIHGITSRNIIDNEIQNEIADIRVQMAQAENNLNIDRRQFEQAIPIAQEMETPNYLPPSPVKEAGQVLEDVFSELDSLINGDKAYIVNGKASIIRSKRESKNPNSIKKAIKNIRV